jgi:GNAT superfamily N-acetyltransferase
VNRDAFDQVIYRNWAAHFGCPVETLQRRGTTVLPLDRYAGQKLVALWYVGEHAFIQLDPAYTDQVGRVLAPRPPGASLSGDDLQRAWGAEMIASRDTGLVHYLFPADYVPCPTPPSFVLRQLTPADAAAMALLHQACPPEDVDEGYVEVDHEIAAGCFAGDQLVAAASGYTRAGFMDLGVLTHPAYRRLGLGKAAVGAACEWTLAREMIPQYRCNVNNLGSHGVAVGLNFRFYFRQESLWLA